MIYSLFLVCVTVSVSQAAPLSQRMIDMTYTFDETTPYYWPVLKEFKLENVKKGLTEGGFWLQTDEISSATHVGTHMDAPNHFSKGGLSIDQIPISEFVAPAAVVDITARAELNPDEEITVEDLLRWESKTGQNLNGTILLLRTGWGRKWNNRTAFLGTPDDDILKLHFPGLAGDAARWLVANRKIVGIGTETLSFDVGTSQEYIAHQILLGHGIFGLENIANMDQLPIYGATLYVMPMKIGKASGAPTRIIATFPDVVFDNHRSKHDQSCDGKAAYDHNEASHLLELIENE